MSMATTPRSTVIGVFPDHDGANRAIDELRHTNFGYDRIRLVEKGTGGIFDTLKGMFTGQASMASSAAENLVKMGMPEQDAQYYQHELDADHVLVLMNADDRPEEAFNIMRQNGAFDINSRLRMASTDGSFETADRSGSRAVPGPGAVPAAPYPGMPQGSQPDATTRPPQTANVPPAAPYRSPETASAGTLLPTAGPGQIQETT